MRQKKIAILCVQEAHLTKDRAAEIEASFERRIFRVIASPDPVNPTGKGGVVIVLSKDHIASGDVEVKEIVPGRALLIRTKWRRDHYITILNVYAPNVTPSDASENKKFWEEIEAYYLRHPRAPKPDFMVGDFNMVEDAIDRLPTRPDLEEAVDALDDVKMLLGLQDGWRAIHTTELAYMFSSAQDSHSRLDRIYATQRMIEMAREWEIKPATGVPNTDHRMVSVQAVNESDPLVGKGRWSFPKHLLQDRELLKKLNEKGRAALRKLEGLTERTDSENAQTVLTSLKESFRDLARRRAKVVVPQTQKKLCDIEVELRRVQSNTSVPESIRKKEISRLKQLESDMEASLQRQIREVIMTHHWLEGEAVTKYWMQVNKDIKPREVVHALRERVEPGAAGAAAPEPQFAYEKHSQRMAELARDYHENLQKLEKDVAPGEREAAIQSAIGRIDATLSDEQADKLGAQITELEVAEALQLSKNGSAAGLDGLPYELWKVLSERYKEDVELERPAFDVVGLLAKAYQDIQNHGAVPDTNFAEGLMSPIRKQKGEKTDIASYCPITLLNTDYKLFTKILTTCLSGAAAELIHEDQAGFMKGRSIADQTKQLRMVIDYAEAMEENGLIVALDQEKAYDKVAHNYLWRVLDKFGLPESFTNTVKSLYRGATTQVAINGHISSKFEVYRGVRQGDPLLCLVFDLAIELLAIALRKSNLRGLKVESDGEVHSLLATLFADDTTVILSEHDSFADLEGILDEWSIAAKAVFNVQKTEIIPIGTPAFCVQIIEQHSATNLVIPARISIAKEGEPKRILGAWFGNKINAEEIWSRTLDKVEADFL